MTCSEWVSNESRITSTLRSVILNPARCSDPTHPWTRIHTLVADTGQGGGTVGVDGALWLALNVGVALETREACAGGGLVSVGALCIDTTGRGETGIYDLWSRSGGGGSVATGEWIPNVSLVTDAEWHMVSDIAVCIDTTETRTRVLTLSIDACFV